MDCTVVSMVHYTSTSVQATGTTTNYEIISVSCKMGMDPFASDKVIHSVDSIEVIILDLMVYGYLGSVKTSTQKNSRVQDC